MPHGRRHSPRGRAASASGRRSPPDRSRSMSRSTRRPLGSRDTIRSRSMSTTSRARNGRWTWSTPRVKRGGSTRSASAGSKPWMVGRCSYSRVRRRSNGFSPAPPPQERSCAPPCSARCVFRAAIEQLLLPAECLLCHALLGPRDAGRIVCPLCRHRWRPVRPPWCERCGQPEPHFGPCRLCTAWPEALISVRSATWLIEGAQQAVYALKYGGLPRIADDLAAGMAALRPHADGPAALVPIPLATNRLRQRGYNQSELLARALARE